MTASPEDTADRIARLVAEIDAHQPSALKEQSREIVAAVLELHRAGLERVVAVLCESGPQGRRIFDELTAEPLIASLLALHDLGELPEAPPTPDFVAAERVRRRGDGAEDQRE